MHQDLEFQEPTGMTRSLKIIKLTTTTDPPDSSTHWSTNTMAALAGVSPSTVGRIWRTFGLKPHMVETFTVSNDPEFTEKVRDVAGIYLNPPEAAIVLCVDEKTQIQALNRTRALAPNGARGSSASYDRVQAKWYLQSQCAPLTSLPARLSPR